MVLGTPAAHDPFTSAPQYMNEFNDEKAPRTPGYCSFRGLPYMTSAVGGGRGVPKKQTKGTKSADL